MSRFFCFIYSNKTSIRVLAGMSIILLHYEADIKECFLLDVFKMYLNGRNEFFILFE